MNPLCRFWRHWNTADAAAAAATTATAAAATTSTTAAERRGLIWRHESEHRNLWHSDH